MSAIFQYLQSSVKKYVDRENCDVDQMRQEFASAYFYIRNHAGEEPQANRLANAIVGPIAEFSGGHRSEASLREELAAAIRPFENRDVVIRSYWDPQGPILRTEALSRKPPGREQTENAWIVPSSNSSHQPDHPAFAGRV